MYRTGLLPPNDVGARPSPFVNPPPDGRSKAARKKTESLIVDRMLHRTRLLLGAEVDRTKLDQAGPPEAPFHLRKMLRQASLSVYSRCSNEPSSIC